MTAAFLNVNSIRAHIRETRRVVNSESPYVIFGVVETKIGPNIPDDVINIEGFRIFRCDRNVEGGGVALYIRENYRVTELAR